MGREVQGRHGRQTGDLARRNPEHEGTVLQANHQILQAERTQTHSGTAQQYRCTHNSTGKVGTAAQCPNSSKTTTKQAEQKHRRACNKTHMSTHGMSAVHNIQDQQVGQGTAGQGRIRQNKDRVAKCLGQEQRCCCAALATCLSGAPVLDRPAVC